MARTVYSTPLTVEAYGPYGGVISTGVKNSSTAIGGLATRTSEVVPTQNFYDAAPSKKPANIQINTSLLQPESTTAGPDGRRVFKINTLERHEFTTQSFIPLGGNAKYLVVVTDGGEKPNLENVKAFIGKEGEGVCYGAGVWHTSMVAFDQPASFAVVQHGNGVAHEDVEFHLLGEEIDIII